MSQKKIALIFIIFNKMKKLFYDIINLFIYCILRTHNNYYICIYINKYKLYSNITLKIYFFNFNKIFIILFIVKIEIKFGENIN